jgi:hypothetical protein
MYPKDNEVVFDTESPNQYWEEIETDEEFKASGFSWTVANYQTAATVVEAIFGETTDILSKYREIIELAKEQARKINKSLLKEDPAFAAYIEDPEDVDILMYNHQGRQFTIPVRLPRKKGSSDSIFVFEKISQ